jgi:sigma-E factor negative regulatory protein RseA
MSEQIREQVSAFLDGELPSTETELLLKRLTRDAELRETFGRYALIGESLRGGVHARASRSFPMRVNQAIDGAPATADAPGRSRSPHWWRPFAGAAVAAGVATVAVVALQQRAVTPTMPSVVAVSAQNLAAPKPIEALSYTVPAPVPEATGAAVPAAMPAARLTNYVFAHSKYSSALGQRDVLTDLLLSDDDANAERDPRANGGGAAAGAGDLPQRQHSQVQDMRVSP